MKDKIFLAVVVLVLVALSVLGVVNMFGGIGMIKQLGCGSVVMGFIKIPFCLWGGLQLIRSSIHIIVKDSKYIEDLFESDTACMISIIADICVSMFGVYCLFKFFL